MENVVTTGYKDIALSLASFILKCKTKPIIVCVGCDQVVGDSLAPIVGEMLKNKYNIPTYVYGDLNFNITAQNLQTTINQIKVWHKGSPIIVVDATVGDLDEVGKVKHYEGGCYPAKVFSGGVGKVGNYCLLGVVGLKDTTQYDFLRGIKFKTISTLTDTIAKSVSYAFTLADVCNTIDNV